MFDMMIIERIIIIDVIISAFMFLFLLLINSSGVSIMDKYVSIKDKYVRIKDKYVSIMTNLKFMKSLIPIPWDFYFYWCNDGKKVIKTVEVYE